MNDSEKLKRCLGCRNDFYNAGVVKRCWSLDTMKLVRRRRVHVDERPPWKAKPEWIPDCYHAERYIFVSPEVFK